ncbi:MAG: M48 family metallopeptidase [Methylobacter sp.]
MNWTDMNAVYQVERRAVKHFRLRVSEQGTVRLIAPLDATDDEVDNIFTVKQSWIELQLKRLTGHRQAIHLYRNQILLFGERYHYFHCDESTHNVSVNHRHKTIKANRDLTDTAIQEAWLKKLAGDHIRSRTQELSTLHQLPYQKIFIRNQKTKWGNCTANGNLSFNWRLIKTPRFVIDYVILHELTHTKTMDHSKGFWLKLKTICPRYKDAVDWLETYGRGL